MPARAPTASRPRFPNVYGISDDPEGLLDWGWATERLASARNYWVVTAGSDGRPHAAPVWALWLDDAVVFSTHPHSRKARNLSNDSRVVIHLESGDEVVILEGRVQPETLDDRIADDYEAKYGFRPDPGKRREGWYRLEPTVAYAWLEREFPRTATRFTFG
jgi:pyridoxine/pyridoxamine 5'-phosphate oxidase